MTMMPSAPSMVREETTMNVQIPPSLQLPRSTLEKYLPLLLAIGVVWLLARCIRGSFWVMFGMFMAVRWMF
jgi:hypothetical protein